MPVKIHPELAALRAAAKAPRPGYFSVLDELIGQLPDRPISVEELRQRLKPGRMLQREDMKFPLKQEEIQYALDPSMKHIEESLKIRGTDKIAPHELLDRVRGDRPAFEVDDVHNEGEYSRYTTQGPDRVGHYNDGEDYFATTTDSPDFGAHLGHYSDGTISFSRGSRHELPGDGGVLRLIDEIQNDRANDARKALPPGRRLMAEDRLGAPQPNNVGWAAPGGDMPTVIEVHPGRFELQGPDGGIVEAYDAVGNRVVAFTDAEAAQRAADGYKKHGGIGMANRVPDAPFKTPQDYGRLEIKNQLLDALAADDAALGITPASGPASWFPGTGAKDTTYDKVYPGELRKIAQQYGAPFEDVPLPVKTGDSLQLNELRGTDLTDYMGNMNWNGTPLGGYSNLLDELSAHYRAPHDYDPRNGDADALDRAYDLINELSDFQGMSQDSFESLRAQLEDTVQEAYDMTLNQRGMDSQGMTTRNIPSMHLTPEVKDRIARIGLPLFTAAGAATLSPEMTQEPDMASNDQPQGFAGGGIASRATGALRAIREASERAAAGRGQERDWLRELAIEREPQARVGADSHGGAGEYGAWAEGPPQAAAAPPRTPVQRAAEPRRASPREPHALRRRATDAESLAQGYHRYADAMETDPRQNQYFVDANKLKALNDKFGFSAGDRMIELQNQLLQDELSRLDPSVGGIMARGPGDEVFMAGNDDAAMRAAIERANNRLITEGVHMDTPEGKRTISGVASLKYGAGNDLDAAERDLMARKDSGQYDRGDASEAIDVLEAPRYRAKGGSLNTMRDYLKQYAAGGGVSMADQYADALEGEYEDGDELLGEDDDYEYYSCGGPVQGYSIGGFLKKAVKKVAKVGKVIAPIIRKIPGIGTVAAGAIGGLSGLIADGNLKGALSGALSGVSGGISNGLMRGALTVGSGLLDSSNAASKAKKANAAQALAQVEQQGPARIATVPDFMNMQPPAQIDAPQQAQPSQLSMLQQAGTQLQSQNRVQPGSNANGLLSFIQQQQAARQPMA